MNAYGKGSVRLTELQSNALQKFEGSLVSERYTIYVNIHHSITAEQVNNMGYFDTMEAADNGFAVECKCGKRILSGWDLRDVNCKHCGAHYSIENLPPFPERFS